jgi:predicted TIM-barrel fold metal-dependent hydrolase
VLDSHIHIGQFYEEYYDFAKVFDAIFDSGKIDGVLYSSTSSCICDIKYDFIFKEIETAQKEFADRATPLFWFVPDYINQGVKIETAMNELNYGGFKLHPFGNIWDFENDTKQVQVLHEIFDYADKHKMPVLIHTGESGVDRPNRFERFFKEYKNAKIILAHCRPAAQTVEMMNKYQNVFGDIAFASTERIAIIKKDGLIDRLIFGTDFPITHYYGLNKGISLKEQYLEDVKSI